MAICDLIELRFLDLSDNLISELPPTIARLQGLESLLLVYNRLTRLPDSICDMVYIMHSYSVDGITVPLHGYSFVCLFQTTRSTYVLNCVERWYSVHSFQVQTTWVRVVRTAFLPHSASVFSKLRSRVKCLLETTQLVANL